MDRIAYHAMLDPARDRSYDHAMLHLSNRDDRSHLAKCRDLFAGAGVLTPTAATRALLAVDSAGRAVFGRDDLAAIADDATSPHSLTMAARQILAATSDGRRMVVTRSGEPVPVGLDPEVGRAFDRIADRIEGSPTQRVETVAVPARTREEAMAALTATLRRNPALLPLVADRIAALGADAAAAVARLARDEGGGGGAPPGSPPTPPTIPLHIPAETPAKVFDNAFTEW